MDKVKKDKHQKLFLIVGIVALLSFCIAVGTTLAWLFVTYERPSPTDNGSLELGEVALEIYNGSTLISGTPRSEITLAGGSITRSIPISIRNTGNIKGLVRVTLTITTADGSAILNNGTDMSVAFADDWVFNFPNSTWATNTAGLIPSGQMFYNKQIEPYTLSTFDENDNKVTNTITANAVPVLTSITVSDTYKDTALKITITADICAYNGNIYSKIMDDNATAGTDEYPVTAYPFGVFETVPEGLNNAGKVFTDYWTAWQIPSE